MMRRFLLALLVAVPGWCALNPTAVWEVRPTNGNDNNGACYDAGVVSPGTDYSQQNAVQYNFTDLASTNGTNATPSVTSVSHSFVAADVGNCLHVSAGTNWTAGWYMITSVSTGAAVLDRACGTAASLSGGTWFEGGALKTLSQAGTNQKGGNQIWVKAESTITITSTQTFSVTAANAYFEFLQGYTSTRGDGGSVTVQQTAGTSDSININSSGMLIANFIVDCNSQANSGGIHLTNTSTAGYNITAENCIGTGGNGPGIVLSGARTMCIKCVVTTTGSLTSAAILLSGSGATCQYCVAYANQTIGISLGGAITGTMCLRCISANNTGASSAGFSGINPDQINAMIYSSVAYGNGGDGFAFSTSTGGAGFIAMNDNIAFANGGVGFHFTTTGGSLPATPSLIDFNAYGSNTSGNLSGLSAGPHDVPLVGCDPFVNGAGNNFALSPCGITNLGGKGYPGALPVGGTGGLDIGALQGSSSVTVGYPIGH